MNSHLAELHAKQTVDKLNRLSNEVRTFSMHARTLTAISESLDSRNLLEEANRLLQKLHTSRGDFLNLEATRTSVTRSLPSHEVGKGGLSTAAQWGPQLRASSKQFAEAAKDAEKELQKLYSNAETSINRPERIGTPPDGLTDILVNFADALRTWIEYRKKSH